MLCSACLLALPFTLVTADGATTRYLEPVPETIPVLDTHDQLIEMATLHPNGTLDDRDGGYYLINEKDEVLAVASDELCVALDQSMESALQMHSRDNLLAARKGGHSGGGHGGGHGGAGKGGGKGGHDGEGGKPKPKPQPQPQPNSDCAHKHCKKNKDCVNYRDCHACSTKDHWCM
ncbi:hypothetical protein BO78DRAFT_398968 [Aspergillus sclerotiicarbonarius CBS 121057]|uniref:Uncharacterized protein n=1 Tax=Aspergillus sclerotiicarbonarius (strain CBS 121057 / IBT 28362) TaxID=1448318 RepID=A0A319E4V9_ASPSB|nr:hypothetical protein BO78DRAFT_398968 [Aspergillus sclerotiicarbonarius CBS 121057]